MYITFFVEFIKFFIFCLKLLFLKSIFSEIHCENVSFSECFVILRYFRFRPPFLSVIFVFRRQKYIEIVYFYLFLRKGRFSKGLPRKIVYILGLCGIPLIILYAISHGLIWYISSLL